MYILPHVPWILPEYSAALVPYALQESTLLGAIRSGQPEAVSEVLESMDQAQATRELLDPNLIALAARVGDCQFFESILAAMLETSTTCEVSERICGLEVNKKRGALVVVAHISSSSSTRCCFLSSPSNVQN